MAHIVSRLSAIVKYLSREPKTEDDTKGETET